MYSCDSSDPIAFAAPEYQPRLVVIVKAFEIMLGTVGQKGASQLER